MARTRLRFAGAVLLAFAVFLAGGAFFVAGFFAAGAFPATRLPAPRFFETFGAKSDSSALGRILPGSDPPLQPVFRFAPSPNGRLHLGHAYSALCNEHFARRAGGTLLLRIEDSDPTRCKPEYEAAILEDLAWLGVAFAPNPRRQSDGLDDYAQALERLREQDLLYPCFCTRGRIAGANGGARDPDGAPLHLGRCRAIDPRETAARLAAGEPAALRLDMARAAALAPAILNWREFGEGDEESLIPATPLAWGDIVLRGKHRAVAYHLAVVVDDALQNVSEIVRGRDLYPSTSAHRLLQELLGYRAPRYRHHRLVLDSEGVKMSKSAASRPLAELREAGYAPREIRAALGFAPGVETRLRAVLS